MAGALRRGEQRGGFAKGAAQRNHGGAGGRVRVSDVAAAGRVGKGGGMVGFGLAGLDHVIPTRAPGGGSVVESRASGPPDLGWHPAPAPPLP